MAIMRSAIATQEIIIYSSGMLFYCVDFVCNNLLCICVRCREKKRKKGLDIDFIQNLTNALSQYLIFDKDLFKVVYNSLLNHCFKNSEDSNKIFRLFLFPYIIQQRVILVYQHLLICILQNPKIMRLLKKNLTTSSILPQVNPVFIQQQKTSSMQNTFFNKQTSVQTNNKLLQFQLKRKQTPVIPPLQEEQYSNNVLNIGFIAYDSKSSNSDSYSVISDGFSISEISEIIPNPKQSRFIMDSFEEISGFSQMDSWSQNSQISLTKKNFKRNKPQPIVDESWQMQVQFTKKKMTEKNKVVTVSQPIKMQKQQGNLIKTRSRQRLQRLIDENSSNEDIRELLDGMGSIQKRHILSKNKIIRK